MNLNRIFEDFVIYIKSVLSKEDIHDIYQDYINRGNIDELDKYFKKCNILHHYFQYFLTVEKLDHSEYMTIDSKKFIEHAIIRIISEF
jgi:hypothetical protein